MEEDRHEVMHEHEREHDNASEMLHSSASIVE